MASSASINNIAATFSYPPKTHLKIPTTISWNPHSPLSFSKKQSFITLYGKPGPSPSPSAAVLSSLPPPPPPSTAVKMQRKRLPNIVVSYIDYNQKLRKVTLAGLCGKKRAVVVGVFGAFSTACSSYVKAVEEEKGRSSDLIACVGTNGVDVMRAWGERMEVGEKLRMVSDVEGELSRALGIEKSEKKMFCFTVCGGLITSFSEDCGEERRWWSSIA